MGESMALGFVATSSEQLVSAPVVSALRHGIATRGEALLLVPSFGQALDAQKALAEEGLALGITATTPSAWVRERWEAWGDGRRLADHAVLTVLANELPGDATAESDGQMGLTPGVVDLITRFVNSHLPWLPRDGAGRVDESACAVAGLTEAETRIVSLAGELGRMLGAHGYLSAAEASVLVPALLADRGVVMPQVVYAGWGSMTRADRELVQALAEMTEVSVVCALGEGPAYDQTRRMLAQLGIAPELGRGASLDAASAHADASGVVARMDELQELRLALFAQREAAVVAHGSVELLLASGPLAEAELVAQEVRGEIDRDEAARVVVAVPDMERARREFVPKLVARQLSVRLARSRKLADCPVTVAFLGFAEMVAQLAELADSWPEPTEGIDGQMTVLGSMDWWPPRELIDFLLSDVAQMEPARAWALDARWRGNRLLTPAQVLETLQSERMVSAVVARATQELLRGHIGTAAARLLAAHVARVNGGQHALDAVDETGAALVALTQIATTVRELDVLAGTDLSQGRRLAELVRLFRWVADGVTVAVREEHGAPGAPCVQVMGAGAASSLAPGSADVLVICGLTTVETPVGASEDLMGALLDLLGIEPLPEAMAEARSRFHALVSVPTKRLVMERALHDVDAKPTYPAVMLAELLAAYGISPKARPSDVPLPTQRRIETQLTANLAPSGEESVRRCQDDPAQEGVLTGKTSELVLVPQEGAQSLPDGRPILSASQVETYLDCPYKWFSLRRLRLGTVDAGLTNMEMGTFAHRVLEVTQGELLLRALEREFPGAEREELLARIEGDPTMHLADSRVSPASLDEALGLLDDEFELHRQHMYMVRNPRPAQQLLVAHSIVDQVQEERLHADLRSAVAFQQGILSTFEPRFFEWGFGKHDDLVEYAGAYFTGTVDRIDVSPHGTAVIIDYKHKSPQGFAGEYDALSEGVLEGTSLPRRVQSLIYAQVVRRAFGERMRLVGTVYLSTKAPHALAGAADESQVDLIFGRVSPKRRPQVSVPRDEQGEPGMYALLDRTEEQIAEAVARMRAGDIEAHPRDAASCDFCPVMHCDRRVVR